MTSVPPTYQHPGAPPSRPELPEGAPAAAGAENAACRALGVPGWSPLLVVLAAFVLVLIVADRRRDRRRARRAATSRAVTESDAATIGFTVVLDVALVACTVAVVAWLAQRRPTPASFGLRMPEWRSALGWTLAAYASVLGRGDRRRARVRRARGAGHRRRPQGRGLGARPGRLRRHDLPARAAGRGVLLPRLPAARPARADQRRDRRPDHRHRLRAGAPAERRLDRHDRAQPVRNGTLRAVPPDVVAASVHHVARIPQLDLVRLHEGAALVGIPAVDPSEAS